MDPQVTIDPTTGERVSTDAVKIDPATGERITAAPEEKKGLLDRIQGSFDRETAPSESDNLTQTLLKHAVHGAGAMFVHPFDTATAVGKTVADVANPARFGPPQIAKDMYHSVADSPDKLKSLVGLGGEVIGGMGAGEATAPVIAGALRTAVPLIGKAALLGKTPEEAYTSALKPSPSLPAATRAQIVDTALKNEVPVSKGGLEKLQDKVDTLNQAIKDEIAKEPNRPIDPNSVATRADAAKARFATQVNAQPDLNAIEASRQQFLNEQGQQPAVPAQPTGVLGPNGQPIMSPAQPPTPAPPMNAADAQAMKQGTYRVLKGKFGEQGSASVEAQKSLARGLKEEIATAFPEIGRLNADESRLLELQPLLERAVNRISNHQAVGIGTPAAGAAIQAAGGGGVLSSAAMVMKAVLDNPGVKSRLAIAVSKGAKIPYATALSKVAAYSGSLGATAASPQESTNGGSPNQ